MSRRNRHPYSLNETRAYPVDDSATGLSDDGVALPNNLLADLQLRYPAHLGDYPFLSSVTVTPRLVSLTFQAAETLDSTAFSPLAVVTVVRPADLDRPIALEPQVTGVGGWLVLGSGSAGEDVSLRFSTARQSLLTPRAARRYQALPVSELGVLYQEQALEGLIALEAAAPLEIVRASREIAGVERDVIVIRLVQEPGDTEDVFERFVGPCGLRPESGNCGTPEPLEFISGVGPDCDGFVTLQLGGCARAAQVQEECGIALDCGLGLSDACPASGLPGLGGIFPDEPVDQCEPDPGGGSESVSSDSAIDPDEEFSSHSFLEGNLPYLDCFDDGFAQHFTVREGEFTFVDDDSPSEMCSSEESGSSTESEGLGTPVSFAAEGTTSASQRNVAVWDSFDDEVRDRRITVDLKIPVGPSGALHNGYVVLNYRPHESIAGRYVYFTVGLDVLAQELQIQRFGGTNFAPLAAVSVNLSVNEWYRLTVDIEAGPGSQTILTAQLVGIDDPSLQATLGPVTTTTFLPATGRNGLGSTRSWARWSFWKVEEL